MNLEAAQAIELLRKGSPSGMTVTLWLSPRHATEIIGVIERQQNRIAELEAHVARQESIIKQYLEEPVELSVKDIAELIEAHWKGSWVHATISPYNTDRTGQPE